MRRLEKWASWRGGRILITRMFAVQEGLTSRKEHYGSSSINTGNSLIPTSPYRVRKLLKKGRARIFKHRPFTILITDREDGAVQEIKYKRKLRK